MYFFVHVCPPEAAPTSGISHWRGHGVTASTPPWDLETFLDVGALSHRSWASLEAPGPVRAGVEPGWTQSLPPAPGSQDQNGLVRRRLSEEEGTVAASCRAQDRPGRPPPSSSQGSSCRRRIALWPLDAPSVAYARRKQDPNSPDSQAGTQPGMPAPSRKPTVLRAPAPQSWNLTHWPNKVEILLLGAASV